MAIEDNNWVPAAIFGGSIFLLGAGMMFGHVRAWREQRQDESLGASDIQHLRNRYLRRMQVSALVAFVGCLIGIGDAFVWQFGPVFSTVYWLIIILLSFWIGLLALGDLTAVRTHSQATMSQLESKRKELEAELLEYRRRSNGESVKD